MFDELQVINQRPRPFEFYTAEALWTDEHTSAQMLAYHLNPDVDLSSRRAAFIEQSVAWIDTRFGAARGARIADFGCGPGLYANRLARLGARVTGIDFSARSIQYAKETAARDGLDVDYLHQDYLDFTAPRRFDLAMMIMCDYCALSPGQRRQLLARFHACLEPGGAVLLDVYSLAAFRQREECAIYEPNLLGGFWSPDDYYGFLNVFKYEEDKVILDKYTIVEPSRSRVVYNWLQYFSETALVTEIEQGGFVLESFYADVAGHPPEPDSAEFAIVARKAS